MNVNPKRLLELAAFQNSKFGHETEVQRAYRESLERLKHGKPLGTPSRKERRIAKAKMREQMGLGNSKPEVVTEEEIQQVENGFVAYG